MAAPPIVSGDNIEGMCPGHQIPSASGTQPAGPLPFSAPVAQKVSANVQIGGKPAVIAGSFGYNTKVHTGIVDPPFAAPTAQIGRIATGSRTVLIGGQPAATAQSEAYMCVARGVAVPSVRNVQVG